MLKKLLEPLEVRKDHFEEVRKNIEYNKPIIKYYRRLLFNSRFVNNVSYRKKIQESEQFNPDSIKWNLPYIKSTTLENTISNVSNCNSLWLLNVYNVQKVKDFLKTNLCKDRFCNNCKKVKQASRMARFMPEIEQVAKNTNLYHLTLTVPNCTGETLKSTIQSMNNAFARITEYFNPNRNKKIRGLDLYKYDYHGAIRSLEVTFKHNSYHPHFHVLFAMDHEEKEKEIVNHYSKKYGKIARKFSEFEIIIQKIWYLLVNKQKVTLYNIQNIKLIRKKLEEKIIDDLGYSCSMDLFKNEDYHELFKYMTKSSKEDGEYFSYQNFLDLYFQLKGLRQIQGYGCFFRIQSDDEIIDLADSQYDVFIDTLNSIEEPVLATQKVEDLYMDDEYLIISRSQNYKYLRQINEQEKSIENINIL